MRFVEMCEECVYNRVDIVGGNEEYVEGSGGCLRARDEVVVKVNVGEVMYLWREYGGVFFREVGKARCDVFR